MKSPNIIFMGTPEFSLPSMLSIHKKYGLKAVVTVPDKPKGRGQKVEFSPVKQEALKHNIPVLQPVTMKSSDFINQLKELKPDIIAVVAFRILPVEVFSLPSIATFNIHGSLLPKYRGAAPINWAIINGDTETGLTSFILNPSVDTGDIVLQEQIEIAPSAIASELFCTMADYSSDFALRTVDLLISDEYQGQKQDHSLATQAPKLFRDNTKINWESTAENVKNFIHGCAYNPGAWTVFNNNRFKIYRASIAETDIPTEKSGTFLISKKQFLVSALDKWVSLDEFQIQGKAITKSKDFINGYRGNPSGEFE